MTINLTDPANHPANGPLTVERITRVRDELQRTMFYANGGVMDHIVVDAIKALEELLVRRGGEPEVLPCPVLLEPGLRFGKGVKTQLLFDALKRRAEYYAELDAMTPEQRAEHDAGIAEFKSMLGGGFRDLSQPVDPQIAEYEKIMQQAEPDGWIPVSERMPEVGVKVLCFPVDDEPIHASFNGQLWLQDISWSVSDESIDNVISCNVTHWQTLPPAPKELK
ncbi:MAG: DUF551 domain-containing protein [Kluyvera intermedia]